jgi:hypothetical protein
MSRSIIALLLATSACSLYTGHPPQPSPDAPPIVTTPERVFVTHQLFQGGLLGGFAGADASCTSAANAAGLAGTFKAWLSDAQTSAESRMTHSTAAYLLVDGTVVASSWDDLLHASLQHAIDLEETGAIHQAPPTVMRQISAWTGTEFDGTYYVDGNDVACNGWNDLHGNGLLGSTTEATRGWTDGGFITLCTDFAALYCIEQ